MLNSHLHFSEVLLLEHALLGTWIYIKNKNLNRNLLLNKKLTHLFYFPNWILTTDNGVENLIS